MKKIKLWLILTAGLMAFCACGPGNLPSPIVSESPAPSANTQAPTVSDAPTDVADDTKPPVEGMVRSILTNEWVDADVAATRPIAVMIPNESNAIPHYNLSEASVIYEATVEGRMSRMMAIFENWEGLSKIGNVRSLRTYYAYWAFEWDAFIVHYGGPFFINDLLAEPTTQTIDGTLGSDSAAFFRDASRVAPHNSYATGSGLASVIQKKGYPLTYRGLTDENHFVFADTAAPNTLTQYGSSAMDATYIDMSNCFPLTRCYFEYNEDDGLYYRSQYLSGSTDEPHVDAATGKQLSFKNILVQNVKSEEIVNGYLVFQCHDTTRDGWYFTNGKGIHVNWSKESDYGSTRYYDDFGKEITLNTGKTMICVVQEEYSFTYR